MNIGIIGATGKAGSGHISVHRPSLIHKEKEPVTMYQVENNSWQIPREKAI